VESETTVQGLCTANSALQFLWIYVVLRIFFAADCARLKETRNPMWNFPFLMNLLQEGRL
jgi:hypothetical protein